MRAARCSVFVGCLLALAAAAAIVSCGGDSTGPSNGVGTVKVSPALDSLAVGAAVTLSATVLDANGHPVSGATVFWNTANAQIATVSSSGAVTAVDTGTVRIAASSQGVSGFATITVIPKPVAAVTVTPPSAVIKVGQTVHLQANPVDAGGNPLTGRIITWSSSDPTIATVDNTGLVTGVVVGPATITATCEEKTGTAAIAVGAPRAASITVAPTSVSINVGQTSQLTSTVKDSN
ncbi:MAG TPA: Ig-like domain-containing protein, partial [Gemmatimonadaceae bacterium]